MRAKGILSMALMMLACTSTWAQDALIAEEAQLDSVLIEPGRVEFNPHWYVGLNVGAGYTVGETDFKDLISPAAHLRVGYNFSPVFGVRGVLSGWEGKGAWVAPNRNYKFNFLQLSADAVLNLGNLFCGFNDTRVFNPYGFLGLGWCHGFNNDEVVDLYNSGCNFMKKWDKTLNCLAVRGGLGADFRVSDRAAINFEVGVNSLSDRFNSKEGSTFDWYYTATVGVTLKLGKSTKVIPPVYEVREAEQIVVVPIPEPEPEIIVVEEPQPKPEVKPMQVDIFFDINSAKIRQNELMKVEVLASFLKSNPGTTVTITGYADKDTGTNNYNMALSERRAQSVAKALEEQGISPDRIITGAKGDTVQPFKVNAENRVVISIAK